MKQRRNCIESCYWHLIEKRFCYDESIALYEDPMKSEFQHSSSFDNLTYYDQVSVIAGRSIVTIDSAPAKPIESQPKPKRRWWEDEVDLENKKNEAKNTLVIGNLKKLEIPERTISTIPEEYSDNTRRSMEDLDKSVPSDKVERHNSLKLPVDDGVVNMRRKSLQQRRMSRSLTLSIIDRPMELPIIRQQSMPKFYIDTPEPNQNESSILTLPSTTLATPVVPRDNGFDFFDLKSVVQLENELRHNMGNQQPVPVHKQISPTMRWSSIKGKLKHPSKLKRNASLNLPNSINHI